MRQPFFVRFLEDQQTDEFPEVQTDIHAGRVVPHPNTRKYPSDKEEDLIEP